MRVWPAFFVCIFLIAGTVPVLTQQAAAEDDAAWKEFVVWLDTMPPATEVISVIELYGKALASNGARQEDVKRTLDQVLRMMRDRTDAWRPIFNRIYANAGATFSREPTPLLVSAVEGRSPGRALDVGMGQGRNAVFLAVKGWDVTGFDLAEQGLEAARGDATRAGTSIRAIQADAATFDYGREAWDLIVIAYGPRFVAEPAFVDRLKAALRPGGLLVIESFASDRTAQRRRPVDLDPAELLGIFQSYRIVRFEDVDGLSEWDPQVTRLVRMIAQKP